VPERAPKDAPLIVAVPRWSPEEFVPVAVYTLRGRTDVAACQVVKVPRPLKQGTERLPQALQPVFEANYRA